MIESAQRILILDFGSQYTQLIARRVREMGVYCEIHPFSLSDHEIERFNPNGIILSGGPESVIESNTVRAPQSVFTAGCPVLGICYGLQTMAVQLGGAVQAGAKREFGFAKVEIKHSSQLLNDIKDDTKNNIAYLDVWMSHGDHVSALPPRFSIIASSASCEIIGMADESRHFYGLQFHPEVSHTVSGTRILERFVLEICQCQPQWTSQHITETAIQDIRKKVGKESVMLGLSGGVDSSVVAALLHRAIGDQLVCVFVDTGLLRLHEAEEVQALFEKNLKVRLITVNAADVFFEKLIGVSDPEQKRKIIGKLFIDVFEAEAKKLDHVTWLAQGTIYSDVIESADSKTGASHLIKSHHNVGGLPKHMTLKLLEPLRQLFKDEVIKLGAELGLPSDLLRRHPFPGPGLGIRVLGEVKRAYVDTLRLADHIFIQELKKQNLYTEVSQAFVVFLPVKSVGVQGDARQYDYVVAIRAVQTVDFMTAHCARLPHAFLEAVSSRIINEVPGISRVVYDISSKPPATIEWE